MFSKDASVMRPTLILSRTSGTFIKESLMISISGLNPKTEKELVDYIFSIWEKLEKSLMDKLITTVPSLLQVVIDNNGHQIIY